MKVDKAGNERIKRRYFSYLKEAKQNSEPSIDAAAKALHDFEFYTGFREFKAFHREQAIAFKKHLAEQKSARTNRPLSKATIRSTLSALKAFFFWLAGQPGFKSRILFSDADYFNLSAKDVAIAKAVREQRVPTLEQIKHVLGFMPNGTDIERRNRALVAFTLLTGARDGAITSLRLKHLDLTEGKLVQDAREVETKFSKTFDTYFFPVGDDVLAIVEDWVHHLRTRLLWGLDDPLFPATKIGVGPHKHFEAIGLSRERWRNATAIRTVFREAFAAAGLPYFNPHSFRKTLGRLGHDRCRSPLDVKAWSQNLGHDSVVTTFASYGDVPSFRQAEVMRSLAKPTEPKDKVIAAIRQLVEATD